jgi:hypothetical protein
MKYYFLSLQFIIIFISYLVLLLFCMSLGKNSFHHHGTPNKSTLKLETSQTDILHSEFNINTVE